MGGIRILVDHRGFPEGPVAMRDGSVIFAEINGGWISRVTADGTYARLGSAAGGPNGIALGPDGALYVCNNGGSHYPPGHFLGTGPSADYAGGYIERVDPASGERRASHVRGLWEDWAMLRWLTAGESHGPELIAMLEGLPAGVPVSFESIRTDLARRKLLPGLLHLWQAGLLPNARIVGTSLDEMDLGDLGDMEDFTPEDLNDLKLDDEDL